MALRRICLQIDEKLQEKDVVDEVRIAGQVPAVEHLVLVAHIHIEVLIKRFVNAEKETVLIDSCPWALAGRYAHRI